ncbi:MAG: hypothetical protein AAFP20_16635 [Cyanobacteria bacterium J06614_10]
MTFSNVNFPSITHHTILEKNGQSHRNILRGFFAAACTLAAPFLLTEPAAAQLQEPALFTSCFVEWSSGNRLNLDSLCREPASTLSSEGTSAPTASQSSSTPKTVIFINRTPIISGEISPRTASPTGFVSTPDPYFTGPRLDLDYYSPSFGIRGNRLPAFRRRLLEPIEFSPVPIITQ